MLFSVLKKSVEVHNYFQSKKINCDIRCLGGFTLFKSQNFTECQRKLFICEAG